MHSSMYQGVAKFLPASCGMTSCVPTSTYLDRKIDVHVSSHIVTKRRHVGKAKSNLDTRKQARYVYLSCDVMKPRALTLTLQQANIDSTRTNRQGRTEIPNVCVYINTYTALRCPAISCNRTSTHRRQRRSGSRATDPKSNSLRQQV